MLFFYLGILNVLMLGINIGLILNYAGGCISWVVIVFNIMAALICFARFFAT